MKVITTIKIIPAKHLQDPIYKQLSSIQNCDATLFNTRKEADDACRNSDSVSVDTRVYKIYKYTIHDKFVALVAINGDFSKGILRLDKEEKLIKYSYSVISADSNYLERLSDQLHYDKSDWHNKDH